jgi:hypothetical protein
MLIRQNAVLSALLRAQGFLGDNEAQLTSIDLTGARRRLEAIITSFTTHAVGQNANDRDVKGEIGKQQRLRLLLATDVMRPIAEIARRDLRAVPEFKALRMPRKSATGPAFVASAKGMAEAAAKADFLDQFQSTLSTLELSVSDGAKSRTARMGATKALVVEEQEGRSVLKVLDALVRRAVRGNTALLGTWEGARAIHRRPGGGPTIPATEGVTASKTPTTSVGEAARPEAAA